MLLAEINWQPKQKNIRFFGLAALAVSIVIAMVLHFLKGLDAGYALIIVSIGLTICACCLISYTTGRFIYLGLTCLTLPIGWTVSLLIFSIFYFLLITPVALIFRLIDRDVLGKKFGTPAASYWKPHSPPDSLERYFHQF